ncbi:MAG: DUF3089 domain-containing protein [Pseudomonadota bacterium]
MARKFLYFFAFMIVLVIAGLTVLRLFPKELSQFYFVPTAEFVEQELMAETAYAPVDMWFSRPEITENNQVLWTPGGFEVAKDPKVHTFYVHPTSYLAADNWNAPLDDKESQDRARIFLRSQASVFNGISHIWAPRYRQAAIGAFLTDQPEAQKALDAAYKDVDTAFAEFLRDIPEDAPIILGGHSQGALHLTYLLQNRIAGKPVADRIVAAYIVGWPISVANDLPAMGMAGCEAPDQTGCMLSWQSFAEPADTDLILSAYDSTTGFDGQSRAGQPALCVNPVSGVVNGETTADENIGTLVPNEKLTDGEIVAGAVPARCDERGFLKIGDPPELGNYVLPGNNYHVYDYPLFWANIRADAERRVAAFVGEDSSGDTGE